FTPAREGVDLNRNFAFQWGLDGHTLADPNATQYHGPYPFSEPEARAGPPKSACVRSPSRRGT
ncbi:MAG: M14 family zinc carboxypeptidase, partial [Planctomycetota bacterium]